METYTEQEKGTKGYGGASLNLGYEVSRETKGIDQEGLASLVETLTTNEPLALKLEGSGKLGFGKSNWVHSC